jgi:RNA polymerase sigma-70 factor (ECF subfamily)
VRPNEADDVPHGTGDPTRRPGPYVRSPTASLDVIDRRQTAREPAPITDAALLAAIAHGDRQAFVALYHRYASNLLGLLQRILGSRTEAEDMLQEVFLQIWKKAAEFDERRGRAFPWLVTLARSRALDRLSVLSSRTRLDALRVVDDPIDEMADPVDDASLAEQARHLRRALGEIPDSQRNVLLLSYWKGLSQSEIARHLGAPLGTVKSNARLGLTKLRDLLGAAPTTEARSRRP